jgi:hypothetical protein
MDERQQIILSTLGDDVKNLKPILTGKSRDNAKILNIDPETLASIQEMVDNKIAGYKTHRDMIEAEVTSLAECVGVATELYKKNPIPDFAFQLTSLTNAHKATLQQLEKMKDPKMMLQDIENQIRYMFTATVKAFAIEIDKTKKEMVRVYPEQRTTIEDLMSRMLNAIQPSTQQIYNDLNKNLRKILGIKVKED